MQKNETGAQLGWQKKTRAQVDWQKNIPTKHIEVPARGIEPRTSGLQDLRSATELYGPMEWQHH